MRTYANAYLAYCVKVGSHFKELIEDKGAMRRFNEETGADLGYLEAGRYGNQELFVTAYCEGAEALGPKRIDLENFAGEDIAYWRIQIGKFLHQHNIPAINEIAFRLIANVDN